MGRGIYPGGSVDVVPDSTLKVSAIGRNSLSAMHENFKFGTWKRLALFNTPSGSDGDGAEDRTNTDVSFEDI